MALQGSVSRLESPNMERFQNWPYRDLFQGLSQVSLCLGINLRLASQLANTEIVKTIVHIGAWCLSQCVTYNISASSV